MKKMYIIPSMRVVKIQHGNMICNSEVTSVSNNVGFNETITGGTEVARGRSVWDDEEEDD